MSLKAEIETWANALDFYDAQDFRAALACFEAISDSSKILVNIGLVHATVGDHQKAVDSFRAAVRLDRYLAVAYFQCGVSSFLLGRFEDAVADFEHAHLYLRGNLTIDYNQLGLKFRLYSCEVLFNKGLALIYMGREERGLVDLAEAQREKQTAEHGVIAEAVRARGDNYTVFSIPVGVVYRPSANKLKNLRTKNYLGTAKLVAATDAAEAFTGFTGSERAQRSDSVKSDRGAAREKIPALVRRGTAAARLESAKMPPAPGASTSPDTARGFYSLAAIPDSPTRPGNSDSGDGRVRQTPASDLGALRPSGRPGVRVAEDRKVAFARAPLKSPQAQPLSSPAPTPEAQRVDKTRLKLHRADETRGMSIESDLQLPELRSKIAKKFDLVGRWGLEYMDEDQVRVRVVDDVSRSEMVAAALNDAPQDDWAIACEAARFLGRGGEGKLDMWILA